MKANIRAALEEVSAAVDAEGERAQHATNLEDMLDVIDAAGSINLEGECAKTLLVLDQATEISALDARITHLKLQRAAKDTLAETAEAGARAESLTACGSDGRSPAGIVRIQEHPRHDVHSC